MGSIEAPRISNTLFYFSQFSPISPPTALSLQHHSVGGRLCLGRYCMIRIRAINDRESDAMHQCISEGRWYSP